MTQLAPGVADAVALLQWYREAGVDAAIGDTAINWLDRGAIKPGAEYVWPESEQASSGTLAKSAMAIRTAPPPPATQSGSAPAKSAVAPRPALTMTPPPRTFPTATPDDATMAARAAAATANDLSTLERILTDFNGCALKATAKHLCFYRGAPQARLMLIGEAPGRDEDLAGKPFVGRAGQLLDKMLAAIELGEADAHITNTVYWRPPGNRPPTPQETEVCRPFVERQIALVKPDVIVLLGGGAANHIFGVPEGIMRLRGKWRDIIIAGRTIRAMATFHPDYLLRTPGAKRQAWRDLLSLRAALKATPAA